MGGTLFSRRETENGTATVVDRLTIVVSRHVFLDSFATPGPIDLGWGQRSAMAHVQC
jgi:hypothetical protein